KKAQQRRNRLAKDKLPAASPAKLLDDAEAAAASGDPSTALALTEAAVRSLKPSNLAATDVSLLERAGVRLLELGQPDGALDCLLRCAAAAPDTGHAKFFYLAQLNSGEAALVYLDRGIELLTAASNSSATATAASASASSSVSQELASAWCARCELFMTDLCDRPDAEAQCEAALAEALARRPDSAEALQQRAGLRLVQQRPEEALADLRLSLNLWLPLRRQAAEAAEVHDDENGAAAADPDECGLTAEQRLRCAEMLLELGELDTCVDVLDLLMEEDDEVAQVWLLFGLAYSRQGNASAARYHLQKARALVEPGDPVAGEIDQLLSELPPEGEDDASGAKDAGANDDEELDEEFEEGE
ncbi:hypothetical protein BOX15_Mlig022460g1, partial [Macrostomum lignano]